MQSTTYPDLASRKKNFIPYLIGFIGLYSLMERRSFDFGRPSLMDRFLLGMQCVTCLQHEIQHRPYDDQLVHVVLGYCPSVVRMEVFLDRLKSSLCHCLGKWSHAVSFILGPVHPHFWEPYYPHPSDYA